MTARYDYVFRPRFPLERGTWTSISQPFERPERPLRPSDQCAHASNPPSRGSCADCTDRPLPARVRYERVLCRLPLHGNMAACAHQHAPDESLTLTFIFLSCLDCGYGCP